VELLMTPYQTHVKRWKSCTRCPLCEGRKSVVLCRGRLPCDVIFVGEAPGFNEDSVGQPFVGPAGKLLDRMIEEADSSRTDAANMRVIRTAFTNIIACIPKDPDGDKVSDPLDDSVEKCRPRLMEILKIANPHIMVAVGKVAANCLGKLKTRPPFVEIMHPAAILRANAGAQGLLFQKTVVTLAELFETL